MVQNDPFSHVNTNTVCKPYGGLESLTPNYQLYKVKDERFSFTPVSVLFLFVGRSLMLLKLITLKRII